MRRAAALPLLLLLVVACTDELPGHARSTPPDPTGPASAASTTRRATVRFATSQGELVVTPLEHASVLFGWRGKAIYVDPITPAISDEELPTADVVFVSDAHFDHLDAVALSRLARPGTVVVGSPAVAARAHVDVVMNDGDTTAVLGIVATAVPMYNAERGPAPGLVFHERGRGHGYVLDFGGTRVYLSGDTDCTAEMKALEHIDVAFVAMGMPTTMTPVEAAQCIEAFRPRVLFPYHDHHADLSALEAALAGRGIELRERNFYPRAAKLRKEAFEECDVGQWGICRDRLDQARELDPPGENDPQVARARSQVRAWQSPFPPQW
jgi:L-ascorbate metabolism protein UlaG (beta-lactamase superfamily)